MKNNPTGTTGNHDLTTIIMDIVHVPLIILDGNLRILKLNQAFFKLFGGSAKESLRRPLFDFNDHQWDFPAMRQLIRKVLKDRHTVRNLEVRHRFRHLGNRVLHINARFVESERQGSSLFISIKDETETEQIKQELGARNLKITEILTSIRDDFYVLDPKWNFVYANEQFTSKVGKKPSDFIGRNIWKLFPKHVGTEFEANLRYAMEKRVTRRFELHGRYTEAWYRMFIYPSKEGISVLGVNITEQKRAERVLKESEELFKAITELTPVGIGVVSFAERRFLYVNKSYENTFGYMHGELIGKKTPQIYLNAQERNRVLNILKANDFSADYEVQLKKKDGTPFWAMASTRVITFGGQQALLGAFVDITARKRYEEELQEFDKRKDNFINMASHELKTPLTSIKGYAQLIRVRLKNTDENTAKMFERIEIQVDKLAKMVSDLLDVSKMSAGKLVLSKEPFSMDDLVREIIKDIGFITDKPLDIRITGKTDRKVVADKFRIEQVVTNLLINAVKYSPESNKINITLSSDKKSVQVSVTDFGLGIPAKEQKHLFERFYQVHPTPLGHHERFSSLGLGLYISSEIVERHGGCIWVESKEGKGSTFSFVLPL